MIESFAHLEKLGADRDLAEVFLEADEQEHAVPAADILEGRIRGRFVVKM